MSDDFLTTDTDFESETESDKHEFDELMQETRDNMANWAEYWKQQFEEMMEKVKRGKS